LNTQRRLNSDIYERLKNEDENFIKTLLRLKQKMNNSQTNSLLLVPENKNYFSQNFYLNENNTIEVTSHKIKNKKIKNEKPIKITSYKNKNNLLDIHKNHSTKFNYNKSFNSPIKHSSEKIKSNFIENHKKILKIKTINTMSNKIIKQKQFLKNPNYKIYNSSKDNINTLIKKNVKNNNNEYNIRKKNTYEFKKTINHTKKIPIVIY